MSNLLLVVLVIIGSSTAAVGATYAVGQPLSAAEINVRAISVAPDGTGAPAGRGNAKSGRSVYEKKCAACHGERAQGQGAYPALVGGRNSLAGASPQQTIGSFWPYATTVFDYIRRAMPYQDPGSLSSEEVYAVTAYLLFANGIINESDELNARTLPKVQMPNRNGFVSDPRPDVISSDGSGTR